MKKKLLTYCMLAVLFAAKSLTVSGQTFSAVFDFGNVTNSSGRTDPSTLPTVAGITFSSFTAATTLSTNSSGGGRFSFSLWPLGATTGSNVFTGTLDATKFYEVTLTPQASYSYLLDSINFTLQRSGTGIRQYAVRSSLDGFTTNLPASISPDNASLQVITDNIFQVTDAATTAQNGSRITLPAASFGNLQVPVTFRFYGFNAEGTGGTFSIDNVAFNGTATLSPVAPNIDVSTATLVLPSTPVNNTSAAASFVIRGANLSGPAGLTTMAPFSLSATLTGTYTTSISIPAADLLTDKTIFVKFSPTVAATFTDTIIITSPGAATKKVALSGDGINPGNLVFTFNDCISPGAPGTGFLSYSVTGSQQWACTNFGRNSSQGVDMNGFSGTALDNEDWLISPALSMASLNLPILRFWSRREFNGPSIQLLVSSNYDGFSNPNTATWTDLEAPFATTSNTWTLTDGIDLSGYKTGQVHIAFRYISSEELGAARWTLDDIDITNRTQVLTVNPSLLGFGEVSAGNRSAGVKFSVKAVGYGNITITAPFGYELSADSTNYNSSLVVNETPLQAGVNLFARFSPGVKALKIEGLLNFKGTSLDSNRVTLTGSSYPKAETFDAGTYNLSFLGSNPTNNPTQAKIDLQVANIATVLNRLNLDVIGVQEVSSDVAMDSVVKRLPNHKAILSNRWSYSFDAPDPAFPPQKIGFVYDSVTLKLVSSRAMFAELYDAARTTTPGLLPNYPGGTPSSFWASGRLPFMATFDATIDGATKRVILVVIHGKSASDAASYNRRVYDAKVLKDSLDAYYPNDNVLIVGDYNDRVTGSIYAGNSVSPFQDFVADNADYDVLTLPLDQAGRVSFIGGSGLIDHITITNELVPFFIGGSTDIEDPRGYIAGYNGTTASDHLPVYARFNFSGPLPVSLTSFTGQQKGRQVELNWSTTAEYNSQHFVVERSADASRYFPLTTVKAAGFSNTLRRYTITDTLPLAGINYYRLQQVDIDGSNAYSGVVTVNMETIGNRPLVLYPNPVSNQLQLQLEGAAGLYSVKVVGPDGGLLLKTSGDLPGINRMINSNLHRFSPGVYHLVLEGSNKLHQVKFVKQ